MHAKFESYLKAATEAAHRAAEVLHNWRKRFTVREKARFDLVTEADEASQKTIFEFLSKQFPQHHFLGEEDKNARGKPPADAPPTWIVDPIDGTTNYVHDFPFYAVSIGLYEAGDLVVGLVFDPRQNEMFTAIKGAGAYVNGDRMHVSRVERLELALLSTGFPPDMRGQEKTLEWWRYLSFRTQSLRRTGSTALNLSYVAAGRFDGYWAFDNHVWDVAGAVVILREAGGTITNLDGSPYDPFTPDCLASNGLIHPLLLGAFRTGP